MMALRRKLKLVGLIAFLVVASVYVIWYGQRCIDLISSNYIWHEASSIRTTNNHDVDEPGKSVNVLSSHVGGTTIDVLSKISREGFKNRGPDGPPPNPMPKPGRFSTGLYGQKRRIFSRIIQPPIINLGLIGTGSFLLAGYFHCEGYSVSHSECLNKWFWETFFCGDQMRENIAAGMPIFKDCGVYDVRSQLGNIRMNVLQNDPTLLDTMSMDLPQVGYLEQIINQNPDATFVLTVRSSPEIWANNVFENFLVSSSFADVLNIKKEKELIQFYKAHEQRVKYLVGDKLIVVNTDSPQEAIVNSFGMTLNCWGQTLDGLDTLVQSKFSISSGGIHDKLIFDENNPPPPKLKLPTPVIAVGFPKTGTTSLFAYFHCGKHPSSHYRCSNKGQSRFHCGACIAHNIKNNIRPILKHCGNFDVWAEINVSDVHSPKKTIFLPQVEHLDLIHRDYPDATFVLTYRNPDDWVQSVKKWHSLQEVFINSNITGLPTGFGKTNEELRSFFVGHSNRIHQFVKQHPSHTLVEVDIGSKHAGMILQDAFGVDSKCWGKSNANPTLTLDQ